MGCQGMGVSVLDRLGAGCGWILQKEKEERRMTIAEIKKQNHHNNGEGYIQLQNADDICL